jgi:urease accessory protein
MDEERDALAYLLTVSDSAFPTGSFGHSSGLEYAAQAGWIRGAGDLEEWGRGALESCILSMDARGSAKAWLSAVAPAADGELRELNLRLASMRAGRLQREASAQVGRSFTASVLGVFPLKGLRFGAGVPDWLCSRAGPEHVQFPVAWGALCRALGIGLEACVTAFLAGWLRQMTQAAMKMLPIGQREAFRVQVSLLSLARERRDWREEARGELQGFCPGFDLAGLGHEALSRRYFRS